MFGFRKYLAITGVVLFAAVLIACDTSEDQDCDKNGDKQKYEACLASNELRHENQTATSVADEDVFATTVAKVKALDMTAEALTGEDLTTTSVALDEQGRNYDATTVALDEQGLDYDATVVALEEQASESGGGPDALWCEL